MIFQKSIKEHNPNWLQIPYHSYRLLTIGGSGSGKTNSLFNLISHQSDIDKIYVYATGPYEAKYQWLITKRENTDLSYLNVSKTFCEYSNDMNDIYCIEEYNPNKKDKLLIVLDDMISDMLNNVSLNLIVTE